MTTQDIIKAYSYVQFSDDEDISAFISSFNQYAKSYLDWFNSAPLAVYTNSSLSGDLLDWCVNGIYGIYRVPITTAQTKDIGPLNTYPPNYIPFNAEKRESSYSGQVMTDDIFRRVVTWDFYKSDGMQWSIPWLKRRIARFIHGIGNFSETGDISVSTNISGYYDIKIYSRNSTDYAIATQLALIIESGIVNLPLGYKFNVQVSQ